MKNGLIAIILVNYNGFNDTVSCVESILKSEYQEYRIVIVDNGSKDKEKILQNEFLNTHTDVVVSEKNLGFSGGNNLGIQYAKKKYDPDYYLLLNNDTVILKDTLSELVNHCNIIENTGLVTGKIFYYSQPEVIWYAGGVFNYKTGIADQPVLGVDESSANNGCIDVTFATGCVMLLPRNVIEKIGLLDEEYFLYAEDTDYCCRIMQAGYKLVYVPSAIIYHKVSASTGSQSAMQQYYMMRNNCYIIKKYCRFPVYGYARKWYRVLRDIVRGKIDFKIQIRAWRDFTKGITGKVEII